jgi:hypothetical protein
MRGFLLLLLLVVLFFWGGPVVAVAFLSAPILFVIAVFVLAAWKVVDSFKTRRV